jgi:hypothetical protein
MPIRSTKIHNVMLNKVMFNVKVLMSSEVPEPAESAKKIVKKKPDTKATKKVSAEDNSDTSDEESEEEDEVKPKKKSVPKGKMQTPVGPKKRKGDDTNLPSKKKVKPDKAASEDNSDAEDDGKNSEDDQSHSSAENTTKVITKLFFIMC